MRDATSEISSKHQKPVARLLVSRIASEFPPCSVLKQSCEMVGIDIFAFNQKVKKMRVTTVKKQRWLMKLTLPELCDYSYSPSPFNRFRQGTSWLKSVQGIRQFWTQSNEVQKDQLTFEADADPDALQINSSLPEYSFLQRWWELLESQDVERWAE